jgi:hypothetical protein
MPVSLTLVFNREEYGMVPYHMVPYIGNTYTYIHNNIMYLTYIII